jgi:hypothetical protein
MDLLDLRHNEINMGMRIVPITREEFKIHANLRFVTFMQIFGIKK